MSSELEQQVVAVMACCLSVDESKLLPQARLVDELYADSMELLDMVLLLNDEFGIEIGVDDIVDIKTVAHVCQVVERQLAGRLAQSPLGSACGSAASSA
ncbi:acyl carrier protein [Chromobacterium haemolyticum]|uniref:Acyl carrier protein n=1 Tax=Chromobacterium fluminis TaxID=3044269 RepID=A0ABX0LEN4_9NEIS|nr:acyl carrier protein [Chromobacterium haemolyticum]